MRNFRIGYFFLKKIGGLSFNILRFLASLEKTWIWGRMRIRKGKIAPQFFPFFPFIPTKPRHVERSEAERDISLPYDNTHTISICHHKTHPCLNVCICDFLLIWLKCVILTRKQFIILWIATSYYTQPTQEAWAYKFSTKTGLFGLRKNEWLNCSAWK